VQECVCLFNPRIDRWSEHFSRQGAFTVGKTLIGRATVAVLDMNEPERLEMRAALHCGGDPS